MRNLKILIDTGAQVNLVRSGLISGHLFQGATKIVRLVTASGTVLPGGERTVDLQLKFSSVEEPGVRSRTFVYPTTFYEAAIKVDAILSYPWLLENEVGVMPHKRALAVEYPEPTLLSGGMDNRANFQKKRSKNSPRRGGNSIH